MFCTHKNAYSEASRARTSTRTQSLPANTKCLQISPSSDSTSNEKHSFCFDLRDTNDDDADEIRKKRTCGTETHQYFRACFSPLLFSAHRLSRKIIACICACMPTCLCVTYICREFSSFFLDIFDAHVPTLATLVTWKQLQRKIK